MSAEPHLRLVHDVGRSDDDARIPPHDMDAEAAVISAAFIDPSVIARVRYILRPEHFYSEAHSRIWEAILEVGEAPRSDDDEQACVVRVGERLKARGRIAQAGGMAYLTEIINAAPAVANVVRYAGIVHERWRVRKVIATAQLYAARGYVDGAIDVQVFADEAATSFARIAAENPLNPVPTIEQTLAKLMASFKSGDAEKTETMVGFPTGLSTLDKKLGGLAPGHKVTVAATTGVGKTAFAGQIALHVAKLGVGVLMFSTEVTREEVLFRALANEAGVDSSRMKQRTLDSLELGRLNDAAMRLRALPLKIDETASITPERISAIVAQQVERSRIVDKVPLGLVIVDYVQRLDPSPSMVRREKHHQVGHASKALKQLAQAHRVCVLELAQAKAYERDKKTRKFKLPDVNTGISDSKEIKNESDEVLFLIPQAKLESGAIDVTAYIAKQRGGAAKHEVDLEYHGAMYRFEDPNDDMRCASRDFLGGEP